MYVNYDVIKQWKLFTPSDGGKSVGWFTPTKKEWKMKDEYILLFDCFDTFGMKQFRAWHNTDPFRADVVTLSIIFVPKKKGDELWLIDQERGKNKYIMVWQIDKMCRDWPRNRERWIYYGLTDRQDVPRLTKKEGTINILGIDQRKKEMNYDWLTRKEGKINILWFDR